MKCKPTTIEERAASGYTHRIDFSYQDIPTGIANATAQVWGAGFMPAVAAGDVIKSVEYHLSVPFANTADAAFNTNTVSFGDVTTATRLVNASESNLNGSNVKTVTPGAATNVIYTAAGQLQLTLNSMANKSLSNLNAGQAYVLLAIDRSAAAPREKAPPFGTGTT